MARYTELSPTGSETSGTDRQSEIVAATSGPITICCCSKAKNCELQRLFLVTYTWHPWSRRGCTLANLGQDTKLFK